MSDKDVYDPTDLIFFQPYEIIPNDHKIDMNENPTIISVVDPQDHNKRITYKPFIFLYQNKYMRNNMATYGKIIASWDSTGSTTKYGLGINAMHSLDEFRHIRTFMVSILQHETKVILKFCIRKVKQHALEHDKIPFAPKFLINDKCDAEIGTVREELPGTRDLLCDVHVDRDWERKLKTFVGVSDAIVLKDLLMKIQFTRKTSICGQKKLEILNHMLVCDHTELTNYLKNEWFSCVELWSRAHRNEYHKKMNTTNNSESWNNLVKHMLKFAPNKLVSTIMEILVYDVLIKEQKQAKYNSYTQSFAWRRPDASMYADLELIEYKNRPKRIVAELRKNKLKSKLSKTRKKQMKKHKKQIKKYDQYQQQEPEPEPEQEDEKEEKEEQ
eukprot:91800_1